MNLSLLAIVLIFISGIFQGTFGLGMKRFSPVWEAYWIVFSITGMIIIPIVWGSIVIPDVWEAIRSVAVVKVIAAMLLGLFRVSPR